MESLQDRIRPYIDRDPGDETDAVDIRQRLAAGHRIVEGEVRYSADWLNGPQGWIDSEGKVRAFAS
jgi:hypothetical protein